MIVGVGVGASHFLNSIGGALGGGVINPLRTVAVENRGNGGPFNNGSYRHIIVRTPYRLGTDVKTFVINQGNWYHANNQTDVNNTFTILEAALEAPSGASSKFYWGGLGSRTWSIGENDVNSDEIPATNFGVSKGNKGEVWWVRCIVQVPVNGNSFIGNSSSVNNTYPTQTYYYNPANTSFSPVVGSGTLVPTGTAPANAGLFRPMLLGRPVVDGVSCIGTGDSIMSNNNDFTYPALVGACFFQRAMASEDGASDFLPSINFSLSGINYLGSLGGNTKWQAYIKYCTVGVDELGTNAAGQTVGQMTSYAEAVAAAFIANGIPLSRTIHPKLITQTDSSNNWINAGGQTFRNNWNIFVPERYPLFSASLDTLVANGKLGMAPDIWYDICDRATGKWITNGTPLFYNGDSTHPNTEGHKKGAARLRPILRAITIN